MSQWTQAKVTDSRMADVKAKSGPRWFCLTRLVWELLFLFLGGFE